MTVEQRELGRQVVEIAVSGVADVKEAETAVASALERMFRP